MALSVSIDEFIVYLNANGTGPDVFGGSEPVGDELAFIQRCLDAVVAQIESAYTLPTTPGDDVIQATLMQAARIVKRRATPEGVYAVSDFGSIRVSGFDPDVSALLGPYRTYRFSQSSETIADG